MPIKWGAVTCQKLSDLRWLVIIRVQSSIFNDDGSYCTSNVFKTIHIVKFDNIAKLEDKIFGWNAMDPKCLIPLFIQKSRFSVLNFISSYYWFQHDSITRKNVFVMMSEKTAKVPKIQSTDTSWIYFQFKVMAGKHITSGNWLTEKSIVSKLWT